MTYRQFLETTKACIKNFLPESYQDKTAVIEPVMKNNGVVLQGLSVRNGETNKVEPVLYLEPFYKEYQDGRSLEDVWRKIAEQYDAAQKEVQNVSISIAYEKIKNGLFVSVCNAGQNAQRLQGIPHDIREDLALIYQSRIHLYDGQTGSMVINNRHLSHWGITKEQLQTDAWNNMKKMMPPVFLTMEETLGQLEEKYSYEELSQKKSKPIEEVETDAFLYVLTNKEAYSGAVYMFDDELMAEIAEKLDSNLVVLPSSVHEILILKEMEGMDPFELRMMVEEINRDVVQPEDKLSDEVYRYDKETHSLEVMTGRNYLQNWQIKME